jgi:hypothetical protein
MKTKLTYLFLCVLAVTFMTCKKTKLNGDFSKLVGTWHWYAGWSDGGSTDLKLDLKEKGKYKLYKGNDKIEHGRLLKNENFLEFKSDDIFDKLGKKSLFLNRRFIVYITDSTFSVGCGNCFDAPSSGFRKD